MSHSGWSFWDEYEERNSDPQDKKQRPALVSCANCKKPLTQQDLLSNTLCNPCFALKCKETP